MCFLRVNYFAARTVHHHSSSSCQLPSFSKLASNIFDLRNTFKRYITLYLCDHKDHLSLVYHCASQYSTYTVDRNATADVLCIINVSDTECLESPKVFTANVYLIAINDVSLPVLLFDIFVAMEQIPLARRMIVLSESDSEDDTGFGLFDECSEAEEQSGKC